MAHRCRRGASTPSPSFCRSAAFWISPKAAGTDVFTVELACLKVWLGYRSTVSMITERVRVDAPVIAVDFAEPRSIKTYLDDIQAIVRFISMIVGIPMEPENMCIRRIPDEELHAQVERGDFYGDHTVTQICFRKSNTNNDEARAYRAFAGLFDEEEMHAFSACLNDWLEREPEGARPNP